MSAASKLLQRVGGKISESLGGDGVQAMLAAPVEAAAVAGVMTGRSRNRAAGTVDIALVVPDPEQPRKEFEPEAIERLAESLKKRGQLQNVRVRWSAELQKWVLISGERRYRAAIQAGLRTLNCEFVEKEISDAEKLEDALVENCLREDLNSVELAESYDRLMKLRGYNAKELAAALDVSPSAVTKTLAVLKLPEDLREKVADGTLSRITAYELSRLSVADEQRAIAAQVLDGGLNNTQVAGKVQKTTGRRNHAATKTGKRLSCTLPSGENVTVAGTEELTLDGLIEALGVVLRAAKKAKAGGQSVEAVPGLLKGRSPKVRGQSPGQGEAV